MELIVGLLIALLLMGEDRRRYAKRIEGAARYALRLMGNGA